MRRQERNFSSSKAEWESRCSSFTTRWASPVGSGSTAGWRNTIPSHPGFGKSPRLDWIMTVRDLAGWYLDALDDLGLGRVNVMGLSLGGWIAAEMAAMCPHQSQAS